MDLWQKDYNAEWAMEMVSIKCLAQQKGINTSESEVSMAVKVRTEKDTNLLC